MPPGQGRLPDSLVNTMTAVATHSFETGIRACAPVMVATLLAILVVALISRTIPQLNAVAVGLNLNSLVVLGMLGFCIGSAGWVFQDEVGQVIDTVRDSFMTSAGDGG